MINTVAKINNRYVAYDARGFYLGAFLREGEAQAAISQANREHNQGKEIDRD